MWYHMAPLGGNGLRFIGTDRDYFSTLRVST